MTATPGSSLCTRKTVRPEDVSAGTMNIDIPSDGQPHTVTGGCEINRSWNMFTVWPHMHQHATHQNFQVTKGGVVTKILDNKPYSFEEQGNYQITPMLLEPGDRVETSCTYVNNTGVPLRYGDSSNEEMCFTGVYKYPAGGILFSWAIDPFVNSIVGIPSAAGTNTAILENSIEFADPLAVKASE